MRPSLRVTKSCVILLAAGAFGAQAAVTVSFPSPMYTDIGPPGPQRDVVKNELAKFVHALDAKYLKPGDELWLEFIDADLAGNPEWVRGRELRVSRGSADWPQFTLRFRLQRDGKVVTGEDRIGDMAYQWHPNYAARQDPYFAEKRLLEDWFRKRFVP